jgi:ribosomal protein S18 acetylase RimI-like enzyme
VLEIDRLDSSTIDEVVARVVAAQADVARRHPLVDPRVDDVALAESLASAAADVAVARRGGRVVGHLRGTVLEGDGFGHSVWMNPGGLSYDDDVVLEALYVAQADRWLAAGADRHYVWVPRDEAVEPWLLFGFAPAHQRGVRRLDELEPAAMPAGYVVRRGGVTDLEAALELDRRLSDAQAAGPSYERPGDEDQRREQWLETLEDPDVTHVVVERDGLAVAQCVAFTPPERIGSFPDAVHLSAVVVSEPHRRLGVARAMVDAALDDARARGAGYAETNWRVSNRRAARYWAAYGFSETYVRLHRPVGVG